jgi:hypothetical protein
VSSILWHAAWTELAYIHSKTGRCWNQFAMIKGILESHSSNGHELGHNERWRLQNYTCQSLEHCGRGNWLWMRILHVNRSRRRWPNPQSSSISPCKHESFRRLMQQYSQSPSCFSNTTISAFLIQFISTIKYAVMLNTYKTHAIWSCWPLPKQCNNQVDLSHVLITRIWSTVSTTIFPTSKAS